MSTVSYFTLPAGSGVGGDVVYRTSGTSAILRPHTGDVLKVGSSFDGKVSNVFGASLRFEIDLPVDTIFNGIRVNYWVSSTEGSGVKTRSFGIHDHDIKGTWTGSDGWADAAYVAATDIDRSVIVNTFVDAAYYNDAGNRVNEDVADYALDDRFAVAAGTLSGEITISALLGQLQDWFDDKESLRDTGVGDGVPIALTMAGPSGDPQNFFNFYDSNAAHTTLRPSLDLDFTLPVPPETFPFQVTRPNAAVTVTRPDASAIVVRPGAVATVTLPDAAAIITLPDPAATVTRPDETATAIRPDDQTNEE